MLFSKVVQVLAVASVVVAAPVSQRAVKQARSLPLPASAVSRLQQRDGSSYTVKSGDTGAAIAASLNIPLSQLESLNPGVNWYALQIGSTLNVPGAGAGNGATYTVQAGDTGDAIAAAHGTTTEALSAANPGVTWTNLQIGQVLNLPSASSGSSSSSSSNTVTTTTAAGAAFFTADPASATTTTTTAAAPANTTPASQSGSGSSVVVAAGGSVVGANAVTNSDTAGTSGSDSYTFYKGDGSSGEGWPSVDQWVSFDHMWSAVENVIGTSCQSTWNVANNSPDETAQIKSAVQAIADKSMLDQRFILATIIQESSGCVRVPTTISPDGTVTNPGLMQDFNGAASCNKNGQVQNPCPESQITQMIEDGVFGTGSGSNNLVANMNAQSSYSGAQAMFRAARLYNSGSIPSSDLGAPGATRCYASDIANRLMGWVSATKTCAF